jgi:hypothetical protein
MEKQAIKTKDIYFIIFYCKAVRPFLYFKIAARRPVFSQIKYNQAIPASKHPGSLLPFLGIRIVL